MALLFFFFFCVPQLYFCVRFWRMWLFVNLTIEVVTFHLRTHKMLKNMHTFTKTHGACWCIFVAGIPPSRTWMSGSFEPVRCNTRVHSLDLGLCSHPKEFWGNGVRTHVGSREKSPLPEKSSSEEDRSHVAALRRTASPALYQLSYSGPIFWLVYIGYGGAWMC